MKKALPKAAYVAFTGTPLLKAEKTASKFGPIVHAYTMQRAVEDQTVAPLLYEERVPELTINEAAVNRWFDKISPGAIPFSTQSTSALNSWSCSRVGVWLALPGSLGSGTVLLLPLTV